MIRETVPRGRRTGSRTGDDTARTYRPGRHDPPQLAFSAPMPPLDGPGARTGCHFELGMNSSTT